MNLPKTGRRQFLKTAALGAGALACGAKRSSRTVPVSGARERPNFLFIISDQLGLDALSVHGCPDAHTPNIDRLAQRGVTFIESHSADPVCSPARSSLFTGRMPMETGVISNNRPIHESHPNMGQWLRQEGYETVYCGKWHLPLGYPTEIEGFQVLPAGGGQGDIIDNGVSRSCEAFMRNYRGESPFLLVSSFMQPHDICYLAIKGKEIVPEHLPFPSLAERLPVLPKNHRAQPKAPEMLATKVYKGFSDLQWRYYIYTYYRMVEMLDAEVGRILAALEDSGHADNTVVILTADHGEGRGRHMHVQKWYPYEESVKVPMIVSCPGRMAERLRDTRHLVSGLDVINTVCDYAGSPAPPYSLGKSLRPLLEERSVEWREFVVADTHIVGRMVRTADFKYVRYKGDSVEQLFHMKRDPWEMENLYRDSRLSDVLEDHRRLLDEWESRLMPVEPTPEHSWRKR